MTEPDRSRARRGWIVDDDGSAAFTTECLDRFGCIYRLPADADQRIERLAIGDAVALLRNDRSRVVGIWAIGQVVAEPLVLAAGTDRLPAEPTATDEAGERRYLEVELLPLAKPLPLEKLREADPLAALLGRGELPPRPIALDRAQLRALESFEFWLDEPGDDQREALDRLLAAEDALLDG